MAGGISGTGTAVNTANYNVDSGAFTPITAGAETDVIQNAGATKTITLDTTTGASQGGGTHVSERATQRYGNIGGGGRDGRNGDLTPEQQRFQRQLQTAAAGTGSVFQPGAATVTAASTTASSTGSALAALTALTTAIGNLGLVQGIVGAGEKQVAVRHEPRAIADHECLGRRSGYPRRRCRVGRGKPDQGAGLAADVAGRSFAGQPQRRRRCCHC